MASGLPFVVAIISASALAYAAAFAIVGIADVFRYLHPALTLALISLPLFVSSVKNPSIKTRYPKWAMLINNSNPLRYPSGHCDAPFFAQTF